MTIPPSRPPVDDEIKQAMETTAAVRDFFAR